MLSCVELVYITYADKAGIKQLHVQSLQCVFASRMQLVSAERLFAGNWFV